MGPGLRLSSVRLRLTLGSVLALAIALLAFGGLLRYQVQKNILQDIDAELDRFGQGFGRHFRERGSASVGRGGAPGRPPGGEQGRRAEEESRGGRESRPDGRPPDARGWGRGGKGPRRVEFRVLTPEGKPMPPWGGDGPWDPAAFSLSAREGRDVPSTVLVGGEPVRVLSVPLRAGDGRIAGVLQAARPLAELNWAVGRLTRTLLALIPLSLLIAAAGGAYLTSRALRPVRHITQAAGRIGARDLSERLPVAGGDEFAQLAATFNAMLGRLERAFEQERRFTSDASHELRTPLTIIKANTSLALRGERAAAQYRQALEAVDRAADMTTRIVEDLLLLARSDGGRLPLNAAPTPLLEVLGDAAGAAGKPGTAPIHLNVADPALRVLGDAHHLVRLFANLLDNAARHTPAEGRITVSAYAEGDAVVARVADTGEGIAPEHLPHLFERFYRVDAARARAHGGTGLGLAICKTIVEAHGGSLAIHSTPGEGTAVDVTLPRAGAAFPEDPTAPAAQSAAGAGAQFARS